ncbi:luciferase [Rhodococcus opacus PD630]|uniref:LLM class flavin-dependent oxidoreductase n=1 Tax=Rhodococcus opacus TaxID=37919 RepID=UPI00029CB9A8|nr:LLM class flavin-dependent oxidoreductase [Rhodococcus opacus]AHK35246.1 Limonene 1,2-monooxygenase [Rhodococcus opacus PD630]EHI43276.1 luciferase [Rhodococcus opacus PD630]UDH01583.1 LLM class flavin-dependent oxidoreductase [Rhodococcus opacus PD630]
MKFGIFNIPYALDYADGKKSLQDVIEWDLQVTEMADRHGVAEAYFAEHYTLGREASPAPDVMIAAASQRTSQITLGAAAHLLPYHNPIALAHRMLFLDHMTGGRYIAGAAPGAYPSDAQLFGTGKNNPEMMIEALDIIEAIWSKPGPFTIAGKYWTVDMPAYDEDLHGPHLKPFQDPAPRFAMTGMQATSPTLTLCGSRGYIPISQEVSTAALVQHWETYAQAATENGHTPQRQEWRVVRDYFVADTDAEAFDRVVNGPMGDTWRRHLLPTFQELNLIDLLVGDAVSPEDLTVEWMAENFWLVGSPATVIDKIRALQQETGGFGTLISFGYNDYSSRPEDYRRNFELLGSEVIPAVADL